jgi:5S rRNA maturation endonuclease (ribonuclease M5)
VYRDFWAKYFEWEDSRVSGQGDVMKLTCPFHADRSPNNDSLVVNIYSGFWHCMNPECGAKGNAKDWAEKKDGLEEDEAKAFVNLAIYGVAEPTVEQIVDRCHDNLIARKFVRADITARRLWTDEQMVAMTLGWDGSRVIIPVPNEDGTGWATLKKYNYNPHTDAQRKAKNVALSGHGSHLYPYSVSQGNEVFLCEGEPDVILVRQYGWNAACGTAGAGTWKREWSQMLAGKTVYIGYDNDMEGATGTKIVGESLKEFTPHIFVLIPPKEHAGKPVKDWTDLLRIVPVDDRAETLARLKTSAIPYSQWVGESPIPTSQDTNLLPDGLVIREGCYCRRVAKEDGDGFEYRPVSNFIFEGIELLQFATGDLESFVRIVHRDGTTSREFAVSGDDWARPDRLAAKVAARHPGATFDCRRSELGLVQQHVYNQVKDKRTVVLEHGGYVPEFGIWVWKNGIIRESGEFLPVEAGRALAFSSKTQGQLQVRLDPRLEFNLPTFSTDHAMSDETLGRFIRATWAHHGLAWFLYIGLSFSNAYADLVANRYFLYPLGVVTGGPGSGKSTIVSYANAMWGFTHGLSEATRNDSTKASFSRRLAFFSNLPVWIDEVQNVGFLDNELLKGIYNRTSRPISATGGSIQVIPTRATLFMSGEYTKFDQAVLERSISLNISKSAQNEQAWETIDSLAPEMPSLGYRAIKQRLTSPDEILNAIDEKIKEFRQEGLDQRLSTNYAVATAPLLYELRQVLSPSELNLIHKAIVAHLKGTAEQSKEADVLSEFFNDFVQMASAKIIGGEDHYWLKPGVLLFNMPAVHASWEAYCRTRARTPLTRMEVLRRLEKCPYCADTGKRANVGGKSRRVVEIDLTSEACPDILSELEDAVRMRVTVSTTPANRPQPGAN